MATTIKSIARDLGISHMTVSRALSGKRNVSAETRRAVVEYATQSGYVRSSAASAMRGGETAIVGLVLPNLINEFYARFANSLGTLCADAGLDLVIHLTDDECDHEEKSMLRLQALKARSIIRVPAPSDPDRTTRFDSDAQLVDLIRTRETTQTTEALLIDDRSSIGAAVDHLVARGCKRIGFIGATQVYSSGRSRARAFTDAMIRNGFDPNAAFLQTEMPSYDMGFSCMMQLLDSANLPDGLVCGGFEISNGALEACLTRGIDLKERLAFIGYGDLAYYRWIGSGISTISVSPHDVASRALEMILSKSRIDRDLVQVVSTKLEIRD